MRALLYLLVFTVALPYLTGHASESIALTTYYPSPGGIYSELRSRKMAVGADYSSSDYGWEGSVTHTFDSNADLVVQGRVGIGTYAPTEELEVNGSLRFTSDTAGKVITRAPRIIVTYDDNLRSGSACPPSSSAGEALMSHTFTLTSQADVFVQADMLRSYSGRTDLYLIVDGTVSARTLTYSATTQYEEAHLSWGGTLAAGSHTIYAYPSTANSWGCVDSTSWGKIVTMIFE